MADLPRCRSCGSPCSFVVDPSMGPHVSCTKCRLAVDAADCAGWLARKLADALAATPEPASPSPLLARIGTLEAELVVLRAETAAWRRCQDATNRLLRADGRDEAAAANAEHRDACEAIARRVKATDDAYVSFSLMPPGSSHATPPELASEEGLAIPGICNLYGELRIRRVRLRPQWCIEDSATDPSMAWYPIPEYLFDAVLRFYHEATTSPASTTT